jgi:hypothetical protein
MLSLDERHYYIVEHGVHLLYRFRVFCLSALSLEGLDLLLEEGLSSLYRPTYHSSRIHQRVIILSNKGFDFGEEVL